MMYDSSTATCVPESNASCLEMGARHVGHVGLRCSKYGSKHSCARAKESLRVKKEDEEEPGAREWWW